EYLLERGFDLGALNKVKCKVTFNDSYPIIFPLNDMGVFKGYVCRTMDPEIQKKRKYLYNKGFSRRNTLVGKYDCKTVMVVEGFMDYLKAKQYGVKYVCALLGWKATPEQIEKLKAQGVETIISALDNDECGIKGTKYLENYFEVIRFQYPKSIKDIGEMNKKQFKKAKQKTIKFRRKKNEFVK
ncbi:MAG: toprim domain-containing protein, partial [Bacteroidales bacterium]|nr:toprim domain-containing protein [Bacteroidales bacterium]